MLAQPKIGLENPSSHLASGANAPTVDGMTPNGLAPAEPGPLLAEGLNADVYALSEDRVLRRYRTGQDASREVAIMRHVVAHGFPAPVVERADGPDLLMERLHGPTMLQALAAGIVTMRQGAEILADLHRRLHAIEAPDGGAVLHLDLHPANVVLTEAHGPMVIDWANARGGNPAVDVALTALIIAEVAVDAGGDYSRGAQVLLTQFLAAADWRREPDGPMEGLADAVEFRRTDPALFPGEGELLEPAADLVRSLAAGPLPQQRDE